MVEEFVHVRARRRPRRDAAQLGEAFVDLLSPLLELDPADLRSGLRLFEAYRGLGAFDAVLAAAAVSRNAEALVSADAAVGKVRELRHIDPGSEDLDQLLQRVQLVSFGRDSRIRMPAEESRGLLWER